ncbi:MAG TPA: hypothetical protein VM598_05530, partial [Bdellovibrionota bacterium]|nr:hypothetical protein [Bdellovibrionota bacterium]
MRFALPISILLLASTSSAMPIGVCLDKFTKEQADLAKLEELVSRGALPGETPQQTLVRIESEALATAKDLSLETMRPRIQALIDRQIQESGYPAGLDAHYHAKTVEAFIADANVPAHLKPADAPGKTHLLDNWVRNCLGPHLTRKAMIQAGMGKMLPKWLDEIIDMQFLRELQRRVT